MFGGNKSYHIVKYDWRQLGSKIKIETSHWWCQEAMLSLLRLATLY